MNNKSINEVNKGDRKNSIKSMGILMQPYTESFHSKKEAEDNIGVIQKYFDDVNEKKKGHNRVPIQGFLQYLLEGTPITAGYWEYSKRLRNEIKNYKTNIFCFNLNDLSYIPPNQLKKVIRKLHDHCHFVQESYSSGKELSEKKFHCYVLVSEICVGYDITSYIMEKFRDELGVKIGVMFDTSMVLGKNILPSGKKVLINEDLEIYNLKPYLNEISRIEKLLEKERNKKGKNDVIYRLLDKDFVNKKIISKVNYNNLLNAFKSQKLASLKYREISYLLMVLNNLEDEGQIDFKQKVELAESLKQTTRFGQDVEDFKNYKEVTVGSLIFILRQNGICTDELFNSIESHEMRVDLSFEIIGKISENKEVYEQLKEIVFGYQYRGKRILLISDTGTGKSFALTQMIHEYNEKMKFSLTTYNNPYGFALYNCPRNALINNLQNEFENDGISIKITGSDKYGAKERESIIKTTPSFLTTIDHAPVIVEMKKYEQKDYSVHPPLPLLFVTDETHVLSTDASYKSDAIRNYLVAERDILDANGISLHMTATPQHLRSDDYDLIIKIKQQEYQTPFKHAEYTILDGNSKQVEEKILNRIQLTLENNNEKKLLVYIESTDVIKWFSAELENRGIESVEIYAKKENKRSDEEAMIIDYGVIPNNIQVILATTVLGSGISIVNNNEIDETWILCTADSLNHNSVRIMQMAHRFRNKYSKLKIFFQKSNSKKDSKVFRYHTYLEEEFSKGEYTIKVIKDLRRNSKDGRLILDNMEKEAGLFTDNQRKVSVCSPIIQSELIVTQTRFNFSHPISIIQELEKEFSCTFIQEYDESESTNLKLELTNLISNSNSKENLRRIANDQSWYESLRREYLRNGRDSGKSVLKGFDSNAKRDLIYFFQYSYNYSFVRNVMMAHLKANKDNPYSYIKDREDSKRVDRIKISQENSIEVQLYKNVHSNLQRYKEEGREFQFSSKTEVDKYLKRLIDQMIKFYRLKPEETKFDVKSFRRLLDLREAKNGGKRSYTILGFKDENYLKEKYGIEKVL